MRIKALVKNAADEEQVKEADQKVKSQRDRELSDLRIVLDLPEGRRVFWRILEFCGIHESVWHPSALIHHNSGKQDVGHFIMAEIVKADQEFFYQMMRENKGVKNV